MISLFFDSSESDPREYTAAYLALYFSTFIRNGAFAGLDADSFKVVPGSGLRLDIMPGRAFINGYMALSFTNESVILPGDGRHRVVLRLDLTPEARAISPAVLTGAASYPALTRTENIYEVCLAEVSVTSGVPAITDTRADSELCGFAAFTGQPAYQPPGDIPALIWDYAAFPDSLTKAQRDIVESTPSLLEQFQSSRLSTGFTAYTTPGTYTFEAPATGYYLVEVVGGGHSNNGGISGGGGGHYSKRLLYLEKGQQITVTVGAGGNTSSSAGQASSFGSLVTSGYGGDIDILGATGANFSGEAINGGSFLSSPGYAPRGFGYGARNAQAGHGCVLISW